MNVSRKEILTGYLAQALSVGYGLLILPFMLIYLNQAEVTYWLIILTFMGLIIVFDFGFSPTVTRNVSYVMAGVTKLQAHGVNKQVSNKTTPDWKLMNDLISTVRHLYKFIAIIALILFGGFGTWYIDQFLEQNTIQSGFLVWWVFLFGFVLNLHFLYVQPILMGLNKIYEANLVNVIMRILWIVFTIFGLWIWEDILVLPLGYLAGVIIARAFSYYILRASIVKTEGKRSNLFSILLPNAWRLGVVMLGAFLINKSTIFVAGVYFSTEISSSYILTLQILGVMMALSNVYFQLHLPKISNLRARGSQKLEKIYYALLSKTLFIYFMAAMCVYFFGNQILFIIDSNVDLVKGSLLTLIFVFGLLELHHSVAATFITTGNEVPFLWPAIISGIGIIGISIFVLEFTVEPKLVSLIMIQGLVQLAYNNWKWPLDVHLAFKNKC